MGSSDFFQYLQEVINENHKGIHWEVKYNPEQYIYEIYFLLEVDIEGSTRFKLMDITGRVNDSPHIKLADRLAFYDPHLSYLDPDFYLKIVEVNYQQGVEKGLVDAVLKYLDQLASRSLHELDRFLNSHTDDALKFDMSWDDRNFNQSLKTLKDTQRYSQTRLSFKEKAYKDKNIIEKFQA